jgi:23S rRNA U2552 (ribose-2'-O)-methylase RlmE/FtsJ
MLTFRVSRAELTYNDPKNSGSIYFDTINENLCAAKSLLDEPYRDKRYGKTSYLFESFSCEKATVVSLSKNFNITNAWMKAYEIFDHYDLIPDKVEKCKKFIHFDNASFPGSFVLAAHHYINTKTSISSSYNWYASSLMQDTKTVKDHLEDKYCLFKNYPKNWLMSKYNDGDVSNPANLLDFKKQLPPIDLYTGDLGFDVSNDYNAQEMLHITAHYGQLLCGLVVLKPGGHMVVKQFTMCHETNLSNLAIMTNFFEEVHICKPATSKPDNSEVYLVGKNFLATESNAIIARMIEELGESFKSSKIPRPLFDITQCGKSFLADINVAVTILSENQIKKIKLNIAAFNEIVEEHKKIPNTNINELALHKFRDIRKLDLDSWYLKHSIIGIHHSKTLHMKDVFRQQFYSVNKRIHGNVSYYKKHSKDL